MQAMQVDDKVCLITYLNAFDGNMAYQLRDKEPRTLREAFRIAINIENNLRISGRLESKRDDPRLFGSKGSKREENKTMVGKKQEPSEMSQILNAIKGLNFSQNKNDRNPADNRAPYQSNFNTQPRMQNYPYTTQWKDGKPFPNQAQNMNNKVTPDPLSKLSVNLVDDSEMVAEPTWCYACHSPHSPDFCVVAQSFAAHQYVQNEEKGEELNQGDDVDSNMIHLCDTDVDFVIKGSEHDIEDQRDLYQIYHQQVFSDDEDRDQTIVCSTLDEKDHVNLRKPSKEEIDRITSELVAQVHSNYNLRNRVVNAVPVKPAGLFMKDTPVKRMNEVHKNVPEFPKAKEYTTKRWDPKKKVHFQEAETTKMIIPNDDSKNDKQKESLVYHPHMPKVVKSISYDPVDMVSILSQISVKVPLSEMFRIEEHKRKAFSWLEEIGEYSVPMQNPSPNQHVSVSNKERKEEIISQIPQMYLDNSSVAYLQDIDPFFLSLIIKGRTLKNRMIDSGASNNIMPLKVMEALGLGVDTRQGRCRAMDTKEIPVVGTINALPFRLAAYPDEELAMSVLVVDIPPHYGMLLSRKWSAAMGGSLQCDLS